MKLKFFAQTFALFVLLAVSVVDSYSQFKLDRWQTYSSMLYSRTASVDSRGIVWVGTPGGVYSYNRASGESIEYRNINGLLSLDVSVVRCNKTQRKIYIGTYDGHLDILSESGEWTHITDILAPKFPNPKINDIYFTDSLAYIAGGFGLAVFNTNQDVFVETVLKVGIFQQNTQVNSVHIINNEIWLATDAGIAKANINSYLSNPKSWKNFSGTSVLAEVPVNYIYDFNDNIYAESAKKIYKYTDSTFIIIDTIPKEPTYKGFASYNNKLITANDYNFFGVPYSYYDVKQPGFITNISSDNNGLIICYQEGIGIYSADSLYVFKPSTPYSNLFLDLSVDINGNLWVATDKGSRGKGIMYLDNDTWTNLNFGNTPSIKTDAYFTIFSASDGTTYSGSWGAGFARISRNSTGFNIAVSDTANSPLIGIASNTAFIITGQFGEDKYGNIWLTNYGETSQGPVLVSLDKAGNYHTFGNRVTSNKRGFLTLAIDPYGTKWLGSSESEANGLYCYNEKNTFDNTNDDKYNLFNTSNSSILSNSQSALAVDQFGVVWIGTANGLNAILNPSVVLQNANPTIRKVSLLGTEVINDIMVDALNNKWIATNNGVFVLNPDGTEIIGTVTKENSPLLTNQIMSLASDFNSGRIYFGTESGLFSAYSLSVQPFASYDIKVYPQPFDPAVHGEVVIDGLSTEAQLRILSIDGTLINSISVSGRKAIWDGKDLNGNLVSNGVYLISSSSSTDNTASVGKIAVVKH